MFKKIGIVSLIIILAFLGFVAAKPPHYVISREISIQAPAEKIFPYLNNSRLAEKWGPWLETDPQAKMVYSGPDQGVGSKTSWDSTGRLGTGSATIVESVPNQKVVMQLEYTKPMSMRQDSLYLIQQTGAETKVTWRVEGENSFLSRMMCAFVDMDKMVGGMFEKGLAHLKSLAEK